MAYELGFLVAEEVHVRIGAMRRQYAEFRQVQQRRAATVHGLLRAHFGDARVLMLSESRAGARRGFGGSLDQRVRSRATAEQADMAADQCVRIFVAMQFLAQYAQATICIGRDAAHQ